MLPVGRGPCVLLLLVLLLVLAAVPARMSEDIEGLECIGVMYERHANQARPVRRLKHIACEPNSRKGCFAGIAFTEDAAIVIAGCTKYEERVTARNQMRNFYRVNLELEMCKEPLCNEDLITEMIERANDARLEEPTSYGQATHLAPSIFVPLLSIYLNRI